MATLNRRAFGLRYGGLKDLFGGSGSTLMGCEQAGRNGYLMEINLPYCDVIRNLPPVNFGKMMNRFWQLLQNVFDPPGDLPHLPF